MSISKNYVSLIGFVGQQPELRQTKQSKKDVTSFGLALNESWTDKRGKKMEETTWVKVRAWNRLAEIAAEYLDKGSLIEVEGKIVKAEAWETKDGELDAQTVVQACTIRFLDRAPRNEDDDEERSTSRRRTSSRRTTTKRNTSRTNSSTRRSTTQQRKGSSILDELSDEEVAELRKALLKQQVQQVEDVEDVYEDEEDHMEDGDEVEEVTPARQPRQSATSKVPFSNRRKSAK
jgi:single-strand DNA-binding protein